MNRQMAAIDRIKSGSFDFSDSKVKTAYALNLCTVSVSQIIDYNDIVILEQEYEAILNNLNIEQMPKDEALLKILKQLLDTITFFRIQEGDKQFIDREYQNKMKNAIWNAVPNMGLIVGGGNPVTMAVSLASQVGIGYMNYRKAKAENAFAHEKQLWQLQRAAIEQFNGLRRELFDTAWRLVDAHELPDEYRLTERQVKQYNDILMDPDPVRRYERLNTIKEYFVAYPPFWYFFGNTANELMRMYADEVSEQYRETAKHFYDYFIRAFEACNLLRENEVASACALEYIDLLDVSNRADRIKIADLLKFAIKMSGNANDVLQLCAFAYLKIGESEKAAELFRRLVNENYNPVVNAQLLSGYYVSEFLSGKEQARLDYMYLSERIEESYLYPFPERTLLSHDRKNALTSIQDEFLHNQKDILAKKFNLVLERFREKYRISFNRCIPVPDDKEYTDRYYDSSSEAYAARKADGVALRNKKILLRYVADLQNCDYPFNYLNVLNDLVNAMCLLDFAHGQENDLLLSISNNIITYRGILLGFKEKIEDGSKFTESVYQEMLEFSYDDITGGFFQLLHNTANEYVEQHNDIVSMNEAEMNLRDFCLQQGIETPTQLFETANDLSFVPEIKRPYLGIELIEDGVLTSVVNDKYDEMKSKISSSKKLICPKGSKAKILTSGQEAFDKYFIRLSIPGKREVRRKTIAILDDNSAKDKDLLFTTEGIIPLIKGKMQAVVSYDDIVVNADSSAITLHQTYINENIDMSEFVNLLILLGTRPFAEVKDKRTPFDLLAGIIKKQSE